MVLVWVAEQYYYNVWFLPQVVYRHLRTALYSDMFLFLLAKYLDLDPGCLAQLVRTLFTYPEIVGSIPGQGT